MYKFFRNTFIIGGLLLAFPIIGEANNNGQLDINNEIIYNDDKQVKHKNVSGFTIDNRLFLDDMTKSEKIKERSNSKKINQIYSHNFITPIKPEKSITKKANQYLFKDYQAVEEIPQQHKSNDDNQWLVYLKYIGLTLGGILLTVFGIKFGKQFTLYKRKKEGKKYGK